MFCSSYQLARMLAGSAVTANALHPGVVRTSFGAEDPGRMQRLFAPVMLPLFSSPAQGAATSVRLASAAEFEQVTGGYFAKGKPTRSAAHSYDEVVAARLWRVSSELVGLPASV